VTALEDALRIARICAVHAVCPAQSPAGLRGGVAASLAGVRAHLERAEALVARCAPTGHAAIMMRQPAGMSAREVAVLRLLAVGKSNREMAATLCRSERTIERHIENIYRKIAARNRADAVAYALRHHLT
jgi:DNA-binding NarL/FixJ family response regulator